MSSSFDNGVKIALTMVLDILKEESYKVIESAENSSAVQAVLEFSDRIREKVKDELNAIK